MDAPQTPSLEYLLGDFNPAIEAPADPDRVATRRAVAIELAAAGLNFSETATALGINRLTLYRWRKLDPSFDAELRAAWMRAVPVEELKREALRRAITSSDRLLMFLLERLDPEQFNLTQKVEHSASAEIAKAIIAARQRMG